MKKQKEKLFILSLIVVMSFMSYAYVNYSFNNNPEIEKLTIEELNKDVIDDMDVKSKILIYTFEKISEVLYFKL